MILHIVNKSPASSAVLADCLTFAGPDDGLILIEDGVLAILSDRLDEALLAPSRLRVFALQPDVIARGLLDRVMPPVEVVDYAGFVALTCEFTSTQSWY